MDGFFRTVHLDFRQKPWDLGPGFEDLTNNFASQLLFVGNFRFPLAHLLISDDDHTRQGLCFCSSYLIVLVSSSLFCFSWFGVLSGFLFLLRVSGYSICSFRDSISDSAPIIFWILSTIENLPIFFYFEFLNFDQVSAVCRFLLRFEEPSISHGFMFLFIFDQLLKGFVAFCC